MKVAPPDPAARARVGQGFELGVVRAPRTRAGHSRADPPERRIRRVEFRLHSSPGGPRRCQAWCPRGRTPFRPCARSDKEPGGLHAPCWNDPRLLDVPYSPPPDGSTALAMGDVVKLAARTFVERFDG